MKAYQKAIVLLLSYLCLSFNVTAQLAVGTDGLSVKNGGHLYVAGLEMRPTADLSISNVEISLSSTPASGDNGSGIKRVYHFSAPVTYKGLLRLYYQPGELNGNAEQDLVLAYKPSTTLPYVLIQSSSVDQAIHTVESVLDGVALYNVTATGKLVTLPLRLLNFNAVAEAQRVRIYWTASDEQGVNAYRVLRSSNGVDFEKLGQIDYKASNATKQDYFLYDNAPLHSQNYYKLQELDMQGNLRDLGIRSVNLGLAKSEMLLYPNPSAGPFYLVMGENVGDKLDVALLDAQGKLVARERILP
jgi:hypothetical protein